MRPTLPPTRVIAPRPPCPAPAVAGWHPSSCNIQGYPLRGSLLHTCLVVFLIRAFVRARLRRRRRLRLRSRYFRTSASVLNFSMAHSMPKYLPKIIARDLRRFADNKWRGIPSEPLVAAGRTRNLRGLSPKPTEEKSKTHGGYPARLRGKSNRRGRSARCDRREPRDRDGVRREGAAGFGPPAFLPAGDGG